MIVYVIVAKLDEYEPESHLEYWTTLYRANLAMQRILDKGLYSKDELYITEIEVNE